MSAALNLEALASELTNFEHAQAELRTAIRRAYPVGAVVEVTLGGHRITGRVTGASHDWSLNSIEDVYIENIKTGKRRRFSCAHPDMYQPEIISLP